MFKALLKKQFLVMTSGLRQDKKTGKRRGKLGRMGFTFIFILLFFSVFMMFLGMSDALCGAFVGAGLDWLYFALAGLTGLVISVVGSAFMSYSALFQAKDNELLMSMPIPPGMILFTRMLSIWLMALLFEFAAVAPAFLQYGIVVGSGENLAASGILLILFSSFLSLGLSCLLGWLVAILVSKVSNKSAVTVVFTLALLGAYYAVYFRIQSILSEIVASGDRIGSAIRTWVYPVYQFGLAGSGDTAALIRYCAICIVVLAVVYVVVARSFIKIATANRGAVKKEYKAVIQKEETLSKALLRKELRHFANSPAYMLNAGLGIIAMPALAVLLLVRKDAIAPVLDMVSGAIQGSEAIGMILLSALCLLTTFNDVTAPSISIEGKTLWITKSMPVDFEEFIFAKEKMHLLLTCIPAVPAVVIAAAVLELDILSAVILGIDVMVFILLMADLGLFLNLKMPKLDWQNETQAVKSSMSVLICILGGWVLAALPSLACLALAGKELQIAAPLQLIAWLAVFLAAALLLRRTIKKQGPAILQSL